MTHPSESRDREVVAEFQRRRGAAWQASRPWLFLGIPGLAMFAWFAITQDSQSWDLSPVPILGFLAWGTSIIGIVFAVRRHLR